MPWICIPEKVHEGTSRFDFDFRGFVDFLKLIGGIFLKQTVSSVLLGNEGSLFSVG